MDATCPDTFAPSYSGNATRGAGLVAAAAAEERKEVKYTGLSSLHYFTPVAIETLGVFRPKSLFFVTELGRRLEEGLLLMRKIIGYFPVNFP